MASIIRTEREGWDGQRRVREVSLRLNRDTLLSTCKGQAWSPRSSEERKQQNRKMGSSLLFKDRLSINILVKNQFILDVYLQHHQYPNRNIFSSPLKDRPTRAVEGIGPNQAHVSSHMVW